MGKQSGYGHGRCVFVRIAHPIIERKEQKGQAKFFRTIACQIAIGRIHAHRKQGNQEERLFFDAKSERCLVGKHQKNSPKEHLHQKYAKETIRRYQRTNRMKGIQERSFVIIQIPIEHLTFRHPFAHR